MSITEDIDREGANKKGRYMIVEIFFKKKKGLRYSGKRGKKDGGG